MFEINKKLRFDKDTFKLIQDKEYLKQLCEDLTLLSQQLFGSPNYKYCRTMLYNSVIAPWLGELPETRKDITPATKNFWCRTYRDAYNFGIGYLNYYFYKEGWSI